METPGFAGALGVEIGVVAGASFVEENLFETPLEFLADDWIEGGHRLGLREVGERVFEDAGFEVELLEGVAFFEFSLEGGVARDGAGERTFVGEGEVADGSLDGVGDAATSGFAPTGFGVGLVVHFVHDALEVERGAGLIVQASKIIVTGGLMGQHEVGDDVGGLSGPGWGVEGLDRVGRFEGGEKLVAEVFEGDRTGDIPAAPTLFHGAALISGEA